MSRPLHELKSRVTWQITQYESGDAEPFIKDLYDCRKTGALTLHFSCGRVAAFEWKERGTRILDEVNTGRRAAS